MLKPAGEAMSAPALSSDARRKRGRRCQNEETKKWLTRREIEERAHKVASE